MQTDKLLGKRIKEARNRTGLSQGDLAKRIGIVLPTLNKYERGHRTPDAEILIRLVKELKCDPAWLLTGISENEETEEQARRRRFIVERYTEKEIDDYLKWKAAGGAEKPLQVSEEPAIYNKEGKAINVFALAGAGSPKDLAEHEPIDTIVVPLDFTKPSIVPVKIRGESMEPTIYEGAIVGVDKEDRQIISGKIYAIWMPYEGAVIKRLFIDIDKVILKSDNPLFPTATVPTKELDENFILGRVKWIIQKL